MSKYEILLQVCESGSISKAAQELNYTQSAVSQAVRSFEKEIARPCSGAPFAVCARPFRERYFRTLGVAWTGDVSPGGATAKFLEYVKTEQQAVCYDSFKDIELSAHDWRTPKRR
ncbi:LysR family transcriptional regulator [Massilistercora timonensis]|uniref:helix-turn-helix domain-containing protein n=1 Tax=Massilistercora timonensis TaxID=2086584 RepID=UPI00320BA0BA